MWAPWAPREEFSGGSRVTEELSGALGTVTQDSVWVRWASPGPSEGPSLGVAWPCGAPRCDFPGALPADLPARRAFSLYPVFHCQGQPGGKTSQPVGGTGHSPGCLAVDLTGWRPLPCDPDLPTGSRQGVRGGGALHPHSCSSFCTHSQPPLVRPLPRWTREPRPSADPGGGVLVGVAR